jgi:hypothetical protein
VTKASDNEYPSVLFAEGTAAPTTPATGFWRLYTKSDGLYIVDDVGASTGPFVSATSGDLAGKQWDYAQGTAASTSVTATTEAGADTILTGNNVTYDGAAVMVHYYCPDATPPSTAGVALTFWLYDNGASIGQMGLIQAPASASSRRATKMEQQITPAAGTHTFGIRASVGSGTGTVRAGPGGNGQQAPTFMRITKV